jgi:hypothetical protein
MLDSGKATDIRRPCIWTVCYCHNRLGRLTAAHRTLIEGVAWPQLCSDRQPKLRRRPSRADTRHSELEGHMRCQRNCAISHLASIAIAHCTFATSDLIPDPGNPCNPCFPKCGLSASQRLLGPSKFLVAGQRTLEKETHAWTVAPIGRGIVRAQNEPNSLRIWPARDVSHDVTLSETMAKNGGFLVSCPSPISSASCHRYRNMF